MKSIYELKLGEVEIRGNWEVMRVPGGWLWSAHFEKNFTTTFVPFHNEFDDRPYEPEVKPFLG